MYTREQKKLLDMYLAEHMAMDDIHTVQVLGSINEVDQNQVLIGLTSRLYDKIVDRIDDIDFGTIPKSAGDITKVENFDNTVDCLNIIREMLVEYGQKIVSVDIITTGIKNIQDRKVLFNKGFALDIELPIIIYNSMTLAIIAGTSFLTAAVIEFIKSPGTGANDSYDIAIDKASVYRTEQFMLLKNLDRFNTSCSKGDFDKMMDMVFKNRSNQFLGLDPLSVVGGLALATLVLHIIPVLQEIVYFLYHTRQNISDYFDLQAELLEMNYSKLEVNSTHSKEETKAIISRQKKIAERFKKIANFFEIKNKYADTQTKKELAKKENYTIDDVTDGKLDSDNTGSLF